MISQHDALRLKCTAQININGVHDICFVFEIRERGQNSEDQHTT